jgi:hypothetical protein
MGNCFVSAPEDLTFYTTKQKVHTYIHWKINFSGTYCGHFSKHLEYKDEQVMVHSREQKCK